jgi:hypothetical protein
LEFQKIGCKLDIWLQELLSIHSVLALVIAVLLNIQTDRCTRAAGSGKTDNDSRPIGELDVEALVGGDAAVKISVLEIASFNDITIYNIVRQYPNV